MEPSALALPARVHEDATISQGRLFSSGEFETWLAAAQTFRLGKGQPKALSPNRNDSK